MSFCSGFGSFFMGFRGYLISLLFGIVEDLKRVWGIAKSLRGFDPCLKAINVKKRGGCIGPSDRLIPLKATPSHPTDLQFPTTRSRKTTTPGGCDAQRVVFWLPLRDLSPDDTVQDSRFEIRAAETRLFAQEDCWRRDTSCQWWTCAASGSRNLPLSVLVRWLGRMKLIWNLLNCRKEAFA